MDYTKEDNSINVTDIMCLFDISQEDFNNIKPILQTIPQINKYNLNIHFFIILSALVYIHNNDINGSIIEMGCCPGEFTIRISKILDIYNSNKLYSVYDTFTGLPDISYELKKNSYFHLKKNDFQCSVSKYANFLEDMNIHNMPFIHQTNFIHINSDLYPSSISLAIFDSNIYDSILGSFNNIWNKLLPGGLIIINKYNDKEFFGVNQACHKFFTDFDTNNKTQYTYSIIYNNYNILIIKKNLIVNTINNNNNINNTNINDTNIKII